MRRIGYGIAGCVLAVVLSGCSGKGEEAFEYTGRSYGMNDMTYNDQGIVYTGVGELDAITCFFDPESGLSSPLCTRVNCNHEAGDKENANLNCDAFLSGGIVECDAILGDHLYYVERKGVFGGKFYKADTNGTNRRVMHEVGDLQYCCFARYENGYLLYANSVKEDENGKPLEKDKCGLYLLNLKTEKLTHIGMPDAYSANIGVATFADGILYYLYNYSEVSLKESSFEDIASGEWKDQWDKQRVELWKYDMASGAKERLWGRALTETGEITLEHGYLFSSCMDDRAQLIKLDTGKTASIDPGFAKNHGWCIYEDGVVFYKNGELTLWRFGEEQPVDLCALDEDSYVGVFCITKRWVYANRFENNEYLGYWYMSREQFMEGSQEWKKIPVGDY